MTEQAPQNTPQPSLGCLPYAIGGLSFIPLVGVLFGLVSVIWGIFKFKEGGWKLIIFGCLGILVTPIVYGAIFYFGFIQNGGIYDQLRSQLAEQSITSLTKNIEFYKNTHGQYPESLTVMKKNAELQDTLVIYDPSFKPPLFKSSEPRLFYYQLEPDHKHYYLLGLGPDGKPFTADDITPKFSDEELKHMGLKIHR
jgi:hypothetical protein